MELSFSQILLFPMGCKLAIIVVFWGYYRLFKSNDPSPQNPNIYRCASCEYVYIDERKVPLSRCGRCGKLNEAVKR
jgi:hypothetical protein